MDMSALDWMVEERQMEIAMGDAEREIEVAENHEKKLKAESDVARGRYQSARYEYDLAQKWKKDAVREIEVAEDREKKWKAERDVARSRYHFAKRRYQLTQQWRRDMQELTQEWKEDMQDLDAWESRARIARDLPRTPWMNGARHLNRGTTSSEKDEPDEYHEETPALPTPLPIPGGDEDKGKDEIEEKEDNAIVATPVAANMELESNVDVQKRRRMTEGGRSEIEIRGGLATDVGCGTLIAEMSATDTYTQTMCDDSFAECATRGCSRKGQYPVGCDWDRCCRACFVSDGQCHTPRCDQTYWRSLLITPRYDQDPQSTRQKTTAAHTTVVVGRVEQI